MKKSFFFILCAFLILPESVFATTASLFDGFESYAVGSISGLNSGTGFSAAWVGDMTVQNSVVNAGSKAVTDDTGSRTASRAFTLADSGLVYVSVRKAGNSANGGGVSLYEGTSGRVLFLFRSNGYIAAYNHDTTSYENICLYSANTWYRLGIEWDDVGHPEQFRVNCNAGAMSGWKKVLGGSWSGASKLVLESSGGSDDVWYDSVGYEYSTAAEEPVDVPVTPGGSVGGIFRDFTFASLAAVFQLGAVLMLVAPVAAVVMRIIFI